MKYILISGGLVWHDRLFIDTHFRRSLELKANDSAKCFVVQGLKIERSSYKNLFLITSVKALKNDEKNFFFMPDALFVLQLFTFFSLTFWLCKKTSL